jgi:hypothetical protein
MGYLQQHKESKLICEEGISMAEAHSTLYVPQTTKIRSVVIGNQIATKPNMYYTYCHCINHNMETCKRKNMEEPIIIIAKAITQVINPQHH